MQDAVLLANHLYDIKPTSIENIKLALNAYKEERFDAIKDQYPQSYISAKLIFGHVSAVGRLIHCFGEECEQSALIANADIFFPLDLIDFF